MHAPRRPCKHASVRLLAYLLAWSWHIFHKVLFHLSLPTNGMLQSGVVLKLWINKLMMSDSRVSRGTQRIDPLILMKISTKITLRIMGRKWNEWHRRVIATYKDVIETKFERECWQRVSKKCYPVPGSATEFSVVIIVGQVISFHTKHFKVNRSESKELLLIEKVKQSSSHLFLFVWT